jgi:hypothetical protein
LTAVIKKGETILHVVLAFSWTGNFCSGENLFEKDTIFPLAPALSPSGTGAHMMLRNYLHEIFCFFCTGTTALSHLERINGRAKPRKSGQFK